MQRSVFCFLIVHKLFVPAVIIETGRQARFELYFPVFSVAGAPFAVQGGKSVLPPAEVTWDRMK